MAERKGPLHTTPEGVEYRGVVREIAEQEEYVGTCSMCGCPEPLWAVGDVRERNYRVELAAPALLEALEFYIGGEPGPEYVEYRSPAAVRKVVRAAISLARGRA